MAKQEEHHHHEPEHSKDLQNYLDMEHQDESTIQPKQTHPKHGSHGHQGHSGHGDMVADFKKRFFKA